MGKRFSRGFIIYRFEQPYCPTNKPIVDFVIIEVSTEHIFFIKKNYLIKYNQKIFLSNLIVY